MIVHSGNVSIHRAREQSDSSVSPPEEVKTADTPPHRTPRISNTVTTSSGDEMTGVRDEDNRVLLDQELEEDSKFVFASDSPSPPFLSVRGGAAAAGGSGSSRLLSKEMTSVPER